MWRAVDTAMGVGESVVPDIKYLRSDQNGLAAPVGRKGRVGFGVLCE
jgi:hypothetical protein